MKKNALKEFDIDLFQLKNKVYEYRYSINNDFFVKIEDSLVQIGDLHVILTLTKTEQNMVLDFRIEGQVELICDKSLESFQEPISVVEKVIYKFGDTDEEITENLFIVRKETQIINIAHQIYEMIAVQIPYKKIHPKYKSESETINDGEIIYSSTTEEEEPKEEKEIDPRWAELLKLRKN